FKEWREQTQTWVLPEAQKAIAVGTSVTNIDAVLPVSFTGETFNNFATIPNWYTTLSGKPSVQDFEQLTDQKVPAPHEFV
ncbi:glycosyl hydrolase, partial [Lactobacillus delbrueckii]